MLYYVSRNYEDIIKKFVPRIPNNPMPDEDVTIERICLSKSISGCFNAASWGNMMRGDFEVYRLYCFDEKDIQEENFIDTEILWKEELVPDAGLTEEVWVINQELIPVNIQYFIITSFERKTSVLLSYEQSKTGVIPENAHKRWIKEIHEIEFIPENEMFIGSVLPNNYMLTDFFLRDFIPFEFEEVRSFSGDDMEVCFNEERNEILFSKKVYISLKCLEKFKEERLST